MRIIRLLAVCLVLGLAVCGCRHKKASDTHKSSVVSDFMTFVQGGWDVAPGGAEKLMRDFYKEALACELADTSSAVFETLTKYVEDVLYDPNSDFRDEDLYGVYASCLAECPVLDNASRAKYAREARLCGLNKAGSKASDFRFSDIRGNIRNLYSIDTELTILFFSNPGCQNCLEIINRLNSDSEISSMIADGRLSVLNIYIDEDLQAWKEYMPVYPANWYNGFDPDLVLRDDSIYHIRAIPSLYLLDREKTVLLKDAPPEKLIYYLNIL